MGKFLKDINLKNKVAVVTGATKGIGRATAIALHQVGAIIVAIGRNQNELNTLKKELRNIRQNQYNNYNPGYGNYVPRQQYNVPPPPYGYYPNPRNYQYPAQQNSQVNQQIPNNNRQISLKSLESMRQRGLISEETYIRKVQELGY